MRLPRPSPAGWGGGGGGGVGLGVGGGRRFGTLLVRVLELALDDLGLGATAGAHKPLDVLVIGGQDGLQLRQGVRLHFGVYIHHRALVRMCSWIDAVSENKQNRVDDDSESMDVGDSLGVDDAKLLVVEALDGREGLVQEVVDCLVLGGINLELHHAFATRNSFKNVCEEHVEAEQYGVLSKHLMEGKVQTGPSPPIPPRR